MKMINSTKQIRKKLSINLDCNYYYGQFSPETPMVLHRSRGPAVKSLIHKEYWLYGKRHKKNGPAVEWINGYKEWWVDGKRHREDGPAIIFSNGSKEWYINNLAHREDGPAKEYSGGEKKWYKNGKLHRENGPAIESQYGNKFYYLNGVQYSEGKYWKRMSRIRFGDFV